MKNKKRGMHLSPNYHISHIKTQKTASSINHYVFGYQSRKKRSWQRWKSDPPRDQVDEYQGDNMFLILNDIDIFG